MVSQRCLVSDVLDRITLNEEQQRERVGEAGKGVGGNRQGRTSPPRVDIAAVEPSGALRRPSASKKDCCFAKGAA